MRRPTEGLEVGRAYAPIEADVFSPEPVVDAIRDRRVEPRVADGPLGELLRRGYRRVRERSHLDDG